MWETAEWEVDSILDSMWRYWKLHYLIQWPCYTQICTSWELAEHVGNATGLIAELHRDRADYPSECRYMVEGGMYGGHRCSLDVSLYFVLHFFLLSSLTIEFWWGINGVGMGFTC
jgi:hypothetical protein